jgi:hypothetical protein
VERIVIMPATVGRWRENLQPFSALRSFEQAQVMERRRTVVNTGKYVLMASSANFGNIFIFSMVLAGLILPFLPLLPIQVLLTNLIYDFAQTGLPLDNVDPRPLRGRYIGTSA